MTDISNNQSKDRGNIPVLAYINGISGRMGNAILSIAKGLQNWKVSAGGDASGLFEASGGNIKKSEQGLEGLLADCNVIIDFTSAEGCRHLIEQLTQINCQGKAILIGSTGLANMNSLIAPLTKHNRILIAPNTSHGIMNLLRSIRSFCEGIDSSEYDIHIHESHHRFKIDAPSGTALLIKTMTEKFLSSAGSSAKLKLDIPITAQRSGNVVGMHWIEFTNLYESVVFRHEALSRDLFADGAIKLSRELVSRLDAGLIPYSSFLV